MQERRSIRAMALLMAVGMLLCSGGPWALAAHAATKSEKTALALSREEQTLVDQGRALKVGYVQDRNPVSFTGNDGQLAGISRLIFDRIQELSGLKFTYTALPIENVTYTYLQENGFDLVTGVEYNQENQHARGILMSDPYLSSRKVVVAREGLNFSRGTEITVAISSGSQTIRKVLEDIYPNFTVVDYSSIDGCFAAVRRGQVDMTIQNQYVVEYWMGKPQNENLNVIPLSGMDDQLCFSAIVAFGGGEGTAPEKGHTLIDIINKSIAAMSEDEVGSYTIQAVLENRYDYTMGDFIYRNRYAVAVLAAAAAVIVVMTGLLIHLHIRSLEDRAEAKAQGQFLSTMSHELRTPLNGLIGLNHLMSQKLNDPERLEDYLCQSSATAEYLLSLVNDILDMSQIEENLLTLNQRPVDLELLVNTVGSIIRRDMTAHDITFQMDVSLPHPRVRGDDVRIRQVLFNLLDNARKFTPAGGRVTFRVTQTETNAGEIRTTAVVTDTGRGMSEEFQKHVFDTFSRELGTVSKGNQGTGLGLPISRHLARLMGGDVTFTSRKGEGSTFVFTFRTREETTPSEKSAGEYPAAERLGKILIAEDNELNGEIMVELLEDSGYRTSLARNGRKAVEMFENSAPGEYQAILMDLLMPEMDGFQATAAIRSLSRPDARRVRIVACSANAAQTDRHKARACGMDGFLAKPVNVEQLMDILASL